MRAPAVAASPEQGVVVSLNSDGQGVLRDGKTVFVTGALPGETVRYLRRRFHKQHDEADLLEVLQASPDRVLPRCASFGVCGGCALQHMSPAAQMAAKQVEVKDALRRIGQVTPQRWLEPLVGPAWGYRRRARLGARYVRKKGRALVGFRERLQPYVTDSQRCEVLAPPVDAMLGALSELLGALSIREQLPQIEVAVADHATALVLRVLAPPSEPDLSALRAFAAVHGIHFYLQPGDLRSITPLTPPAPALSYRLAAFDVTLEFEPSDFIQINATLNCAMVAQALELLELDSKSEVLDLFCGLGNFTLPMARRAARVVGVEGDAELIARAQANATRNGIHNVAFHVGNLAAPELTAAPLSQAWAKQSYTHVLLDPPRVGAAELLSHLAALKPQRIVYVSCHPGSLARDLGILVAQHGYNLLAAGAMDMFPHTTHVESMALLARGKR